MLPNIEVLGVLGSEFGKKDTSFVRDKSSKDYVALGSNSLTLFLERVYSEMKYHRGIGTSVRRSSRSAFGRLTGNDVSGHYKRHYFLSFFFFLFFSFFFSVVYFSHRRRALIKNLFRES